MAACKRSRRSACAGLILRLATSSEKKSAWSTSGNILRLPECGGHSISHKLDFIPNACGTSPAKAQACTILPPFCLIHPSAIQSRPPSGRKPTSSSNSNGSRVSKSSPEAASAFGMVDMPSSLRAKSGPPGCAKRNSSSSFLRRNMSRPALMRLRLDFGCSRTHHLTRKPSSVHFVRRRVLDIFVTPQVKRVGEHNITHHAPQIVVTEIECWIELEIRCDIAGETDRRRVFRAALPINLHSPSLIEVVGIAEDCFVLVPGMSGSDDH